ncbi:cytidylyltransferase domain-containing protein [Thalassospira tepidiphila]|uniref:acylneuraminate cytidylyltransferase family protein n=1 Tax=Thalassospira tepidiphila TaxID=393657 RepID=UPI003AA99FD7
MKATVIIPARAGSKGVPLKNIALVNGKPLITYCINAALQAKSVNKVIVSTDGEQIADIAESAGAEIIMRPSSISGDASSSEDAVIHALEKLQKESSLTEYTFFAQCTSPLTSSHDFDNAMQAMQEGNYDSLFAATKFHHFLWKKDQDGYAIGINHDPSERRKMRQELAPEYLEAGAFYLFRTLSFLQFKHRFFGRIGIYEIPDERLFEIDTHSDIIKANSLMKTVSQKY